VKFNFFVSDYIILNFKMNESWRFGKKARLKLCVPRKKPNLANFKLKKLENHEKNEEVIIILY